MNYLFLRKLYPNIFTLNILMYLNVAQFLPPFDVGKNQCYSLEENATVKVYRIYYPLYLSNSWVILGVMFSQCQIFLPKMQIHVELKSDRVKRQIRRDISRMTIMTISKPFKRISETNKLLSLSPCPASLTEIFSENTTLVLFKGITYSRFRISHRR